MEIRIIQDLMNIDQMEEMLNIDMEVRLLEDEISKLSEERERLLLKPPTFALLLTVLPVHK